MNKEICIVGHFDIGEIYNKASKILLEQAHGLDFHYGVIIGDIGIENKLIDFIVGGPKLLAKSYLSRKKCANSICVASQLPSTVKEILTIIDIKQFEELVLNLKRTHLNIYESICLEVDLKLPEKRDLSICIKSQINNSIVPRRLKEYNLDLSRTILFSEKNLRNIVGQRLKRSRAKNWNNVIPRNLVVNGNNNPICRGIMFALFEKISEQTFSQVNFLIEYRHLKAFTNGWLLFDSYQNQIPYLKNLLKAGDFKTELNFIKKQ